MQKLSIYIRCYSNFVPVCFLHHDCVCVLDCPSIEEFLDINEVPMSISLLQRMEEACGDVAAEAYWGWISHALQYFPCCFFRENIDSSMRSCAQTETAWWNLIFFFFTVHAERLLYLLSVTFVLYKTIYKLDSVLIQYLRKVPKNIIGLVQLWAAAAKSTFSLSAASQFSIFSFAVQVPHSTAKVRQFSTAI